MRSNDIVKPGNSPGMQVCSNIFTLILFCSIYQHCFSIILKKNRIALPDIKKMNC